MARGTVFLVDDDSSVRRALTRLIRLAGYDVEVLEDAASYLERPAPASPACLVLDVRMPGMSGLELQRAISGTPRALPVVFVTAHGHEEVRGQALALGAIEVLLKPLEPEALFGAIEKALAVHEPAG
jgi:FixJ family two-component response regulator